jgi:hypothetical protein
MENCEWLNDTDIGPCAGQLQTMTSESSEPRQHQGITSKDRHRPDAIQ